MKAVIAVFLRLGGELSSYGAKRYISGIAHVDIGKSWFGPAQEKRAIDHDGNWHDGTRN